MSVVINNHMTRDWSVAVPGVNVLVPNSSAMAMKENAAYFTVPAQSSKVCDFWDKIKDVKSIQSLLDRGRLSLGEDDEPSARTAQHFVTLGSTLKAPENLRQNDPEVSVNGRVENLQEMINSPAAAVVDAMNKEGRRRGRPPKVIQDTEA